MDSSRLRPDDGSKAATDLHTQMESLLDCVWQAEQTWRLTDRIDLAIAVDEQRQRQRLRLQRRGLRSA